MIEEKVKNLEKILVASWVNDQFRLYEPELYKKWQKSQKELIMGPERESGSESDAGHFVLRVYRTSDGLWLDKTWIDHIGYTWDEAHLYFLPNGDQIF